MRSTGGFEQTDGIAAATEALCALDLTVLSDEQIARVLQTAETVRRRLDGLDARAVAQVQERGLHEAVKLSTPLKYLIDLLRLSRDAGRRQCSHIRLSFDRPGPMLRDGIERLAAAWASYTTARPRPDRARLTRMLS